MSSSADVVMGALDALKARDWEGFANRLHPDVVHRTPGVPEPILSSPAGRVRQPSVSVIDLRNGQIWRDLEYVGLAM